jgi:hypothetical protein
MDHPVSIERYIKLITKEALDTGVIKKWFHCVTTHAPSGIIRTISTTDNKGAPKSVSLVHQESDHQHAYLVPLTRDLSEPEIETIVNAFVDTELVDNFDVETNETRLLASDHTGVSLDAAKHLQLCSALAKQKHEDWVRERTGAGWRYGTKFDDDERTHPLIRPWDQIPDRYKQPDMDWPQKLMQTLNDQGYAIVPKDKLDRLMTLLQGSV